MAGDFTQIDTDSEPDWAEFERLLAGFAQLAKSDASFGQVAKELLTLIDDSLAPIAAAIWMRYGRDALTQECQFGLAESLSHVTSAEHENLLMRMARIGRPAQLAPKQQEPIQNPTGCHVLVVPLLIDDDVAGLVEVLQRPDIGRESLEGNQRFVSLLSELAADNLRRRELRQLRDRQRQTGQFEKFTEAIHQSLDPRATAATIANQGRPLIGCDRLTVAARRGSRFRLLAMSAVDVIHRRSRQVRRLEKLLSRVAKTGEPQFFEAGDTSTAPQIEHVLNDYFDDSQSCSLGVVPLIDLPENEQSATGKVVGALVVEHFDGTSWEDSRPMATAVARHASLALTNSLSYRALPTLPLIRRRRVTGEPTRRLQKLLGIILIVAAIASTFVIQTDFHVPATGELQPTLRQDLFAPLDGQIAQVAVEHGTPVKQGQLLIEMTSPELNLELQQIQGEHDATLQRLRSIESVMLLPGNAGTSRDDAQASQLAAEKEELKILSDSQQQRLELLREERKRLMIRSPIDGIVLTWETNQLLGNRPVRRGQRLLTVADVDGDWEAEVHVADDDVGPLLPLVGPSGGPDAKLELATDRGTTLAARVRRLAGRAEVDSENMSVIRVVLSVDLDSDMEPRPGATVFAKIDCGRRSIFHVWCHKIVDRVESWFSF